MKGIFIVLLFSCSMVYGQRVGIGNTNPAAKLDITGVGTAPSIPGSVSTGILRIGINGSDAIDIGKMSTGTFSGWIQAGYDGLVPDPLSLNPMGGSVGIGTTSPSTKAIVDMTSTTKGFLPPRMTYVQRNAITSPPAGLVLWCSNCGSLGELQVFNGQAWTNMIGKPASPELTIGAEYGGGKVAYILQPGDPGYTAGQLHGLIMFYGFFHELGWYCDDYFFGESQTGLGQGYDNTYTIATTCQSNLGVCRFGYDYSNEIDNYYDWFIPSKDELNKIYLNRIPLGADLGYTFWSSSEVSQSFVWAQNFATGSAYQESKLYENACVLVRSF